MQVEPNVNVEYILSLGSFRQLNKEDEDGDHARNHRI